ncbi:MAG: bifunctional diaminohydroxyphosphoribosylaminopyrimidine deaminase/5-amino-6-(5-phosphoribosylamino)uracil reductase RibD [Gammaproteobacteria bacterium]
MSQPLFNAQDHQHMADAIRLAWRGLYTTHPNPRVGCVIVNDGIVVGQGWHEFAGQGHAEVNALRAAGNAARGATVYVSLEPCSHHGKTPPCANALIAAGVAKVVSAMKAIPKVSGNGHRLLQAAGIETACVACWKPGPRRESRVSPTHADRPALDYPEVRHEC